MCYQCIKDKNIAISESTNALKPFTEIPEGFDDLVFNSININYPNDKLSTNVKDYVFISTPIFSYGVPNSNGIAYPGPEEVKESLLTAIGKPVIVDHNIEDATIIGIIVDVKLAIDAAYVLLAIDLSKKENKSILNYLIDADIAEFSISSYSNNFVCSICGTPIDKISTNTGFKAVCCEHLSGKAKFDKQGYIYCINYNHGAYILKRDFTTIEVSLVDKGSEKVSHTNKGYSIS